MQIIFCTLSFRLITREDRPNSNTNNLPSCDFMRSARMIVKELETPEAILARFGILSNFTAGEKKKVSNDLSSRKKES